LKLRAYPNEHYLILKASVILSITRLFYDFVVRSADSLLDFSFGSEGPNSMQHKFA